jgi:KUP system potassium uptake protein
MKGNSHLNRLSAIGLLIALGIIYGDIGTSPLYVMKAIIGEDLISRELVMGGLSCVFWTLTLQTTVKYVIITLRADNRGEGGIFSLFALVRRRIPFLVWISIIGGATLLADGIITPPISVSSAVEGLRIFNPEIPTIPITIAILVLLFVVQGFGTNIMGSTFGPVMMIWFLMLALLGSVHIVHHPWVLESINPYYAVNLLLNYPNGFWLLGAVFLCTTGAEALYSDMGHCGRHNIRVSWIFVKCCLLLNYFGQGAWLMQSVGQKLNGQNPFYEIMPHWFLIYGIIIATLAAIIASQALITGSFTLISEAIRLNLWPKVKINYPTITKGQIYVPSINWLLMFGCIGIVLHFEESSHMEAAYGLAISLTMLMTTILLFYYLRYIKKVSFLISSTIFTTYLLIESAFLTANLSKFHHGGYVTLIIAGVIVFIMIVWYSAYRIKKNLTEYVPIVDYLPLLQELSGDISVPKYATHLIYMTSTGSSHEIESKIIYSIFQKQPKRSDIYWFIHIDVLDDPYTMEYKVDIMRPDDAIRVNFRLGFRIEHKINLFFRKVVEDLVKSKEVDFTSRYSSLHKHNVIGDFRFVVLEKHLSNENDLSPKDKLIMSSYFFLKKISLSEQSAFGLDTSSVTVEKVPMIISPVEDFQLTRVT